MGGLCGLDTRDVIEGKSLSLRNVPIVLGALLVGEAHRATFPAPAQATQGRFPLSWGKTISRFGAGC